MYNRHVNVIGLDEGDFRRAVEIAMSEHDTAAAYVVLEEGPTMILFWMTDDQDENLPLPYPLNAVQATKFLWDWLQTIEITESQPDMDGTVRPGAWSVRAGHPERYEDRLPMSHRGILMVKPEWALYPK